MSKVNDKKNNTQSNNIDSTELNISAIESISNDIINHFYNEENLLPVVMATLTYIDECVEKGLTLPYFSNIDNDLWKAKPRALDIYITDGVEGRTLNLEARGKDNPTNILSYPSEMPANIIELMPMLLIGELIICHEVVVSEAAEQDKTIAQHISHLVIHGMLHLLGFDHELGQAEQDEMERFEIDILMRLDIPNPYQ